MTKKLPNQTRFFTKISSAFSILEMSIVLLILGLIIAGISQGSGIYYEYNLRTARSLTKSSDVALFPGLVLWLDASAENSLTNTSNYVKVENNDTIKTWIDQNPQVDVNSRFTFTEKASGEGPIYLEKGINNLPTLYFDFVAGSTNVGDGLIASFSKILSSDSFTVFTVVQPIENTGTWETIIMNRDAISSPGYAGFNLYKNISTSTFELWTGSGGPTNGWIVTSDASTFNLNTPYILSAKRTGLTTSDDSIFYRNGTQTAITSSVTYASNNLASTVVYIGAAGSAYFDGYISEIILYNRSLQNRERIAIEKYLSQKYKINLS